MGRIRTIKPEFPQSESIGQLSRDARLLFIQLFTVVDDSGRTRGASRMLASLLYPYDEDAPSLIEGWLTELENEGQVRRYVVDGHSYLEVCNWLTHQKIDKPSPSKHPPFANIREDSPKPREKLLRTKDQGEEGNRTGTLGMKEVSGPDTVDTRCLSESVGIFGMKEQEGMNRLLVVHMKETGRDVQTAIEHMIARWVEYQQASPLLEWSYGSSYKFFMSGNWDAPQTWPRADAKLSPKEAARRAFEERVCDDDEAQ